MPQQPSYNPQEIVYDSVKWKKVEDTSEDIWIGKICKKLVLMEIRKIQKMYYGTIKWFEKSHTFKINGASNKLEEAQACCMNSFADWIYNNADNFINTKPKDIQWEPVKNKDGRVVSQVADLDGYFRLRVYPVSFAGKRKLKCCIEGASDMYMISKEFDYSAEDLDEIKKYCLGKLKSMLIAFREDYRRRNDMRVARSDPKTDVGQGEIFLFDDIAEPELQEDNRIEVTDKEGRCYYMEVDLKDLESLKRYEWHLSKKRGKVAALSNTLKDHNGKDKRIYAHRLILGAGDDVKIRHKNGNGLDNRRENLEIVSKKVESRKVYDHAGQFIGTIAGSKFYKKLDVK